MNMQYFSCSSEGVSKCRPLVTISAPEYFKVHINMEVLMKKNRMKAQEQQLTTSAD
jgi:hypothetical protein